MRSLFAPLRVSRIARRSLTRVSRSAFAFAFLVIATAMTLPSRSFADDSCLAWVSNPSTTQRTGAAAIWDPVRHRMIMFGGYSGSKFLGDVIALGASPTSVWTPIETSGPAPEPRDGANAVYDPVRDQLVLFGGNNHSGAFLNDVWTLSLSGTPTWTKLTVADPPSGRFVPSVIYDPIRDRFLLFGGYNGIDQQYWNEVWQLTLSGTPTWTQLTPAGTPPPGRYAHVAIYDPVRDRMLVYGGEDRTTHYRDLWQLALAGTTTWTYLSTTGTPLPPSHVPSAIYDPVGDRMLVYGGFDLAASSKLIALSLSTIPAGWSELHPGGVSVPARSWHSAVYDPDGRRMLWTGGQPFADPSNMQPTATYSLELSQGAVTLAVAANNGSLGHVDQSPGGPCHTLNEVVTLTAVPAAGCRFVQWTGDLTGSTNPQSILMDRNKTVTAVFEVTPPCEGQFILSLVINNSALGQVNQSPVGGCQPPGTVVTLTAVPAAGCRFVQWTGDQTGTANPQSLVMDRNKTVVATFEVIPPCDGSFTLSVGANDGALGHVTQSPSAGCYAPGAVVTLTAIPAPGARFVQWTGDLTGNTNPQSLTMDRNKSVLATFEAIPPCNEWTDLAPSPGTIRRNGAATIWDPVRHRMIMFGGDDGTQLRRDILTLDAAGTAWTPLAAIGTPYLPSPRQGANAVYDPVRDRLILFGGWEKLYLNDVWALSLSGTPTWTQLVPATEYDPSAPLARYLTSMIYDPLRDRLVVFGGKAFGGPYSNEVWALPLSGPPAWQQLAPGAGPVPRYAHAATYDPVHDAMVVYGGGDTGGARSDVWQLSLAGSPEWTQLHPVIPGLALLSSAADFDAASNRMVIFGGYSITNGNPTYTSTTQALSLDADPPVWVAMQPGGTVPPPRAGASAVIDPSLRRLLVAGGQNGTGILLSSAYALDLSHGSLILSVASNDPNLGHVEQAPGGDCHEQGDVVTLTAVPSAGCRFVQWTGDLTGSANPQSITMDQDKSVIAVFQVVPPCEGMFSLSVTSNSATLGHVNQSPAGNCQPMGGLVTLTAVPAAGCRFVQWTGDLTGNTNPQSITMDQNKSVVAVFQVIPPCDGLFVLSVTSNDATLGHVDQAPAGSCQSPGTVVTLSAIPASGCRFLQWSGDVTGNNNPQSLTMDGNKSVLATFEVIPPCEGQFILSVASNNPARGQVNQSPAGTCQPQGGIVTLAAIPAAGCRFVQWSGDLTGTENPRSFTMDRNKTILATFEVLPPCSGSFTLSVGTNDAALGLVLQSPTANCYSPGDVVTLTAIPAAGCRFVQWQGGLTGTINPQSITMDGNKVVLATFELVPVCDEWTDLAPSPGTIRRNGAATIWDPIRHRMIMFGGDDGSQLRRDLLTLDPAAPAWIPLAASGTPYLPSPRQGANAVYDPVRDRLILFGGWEKLYLNDVWALSLSGTPTWTQLVPPTEFDPSAPSARYLTSMIYDPVRDRVVVFGGKSFGGQYFNEVWALPLSGPPTWQQLAPGPGPSPRYAHVATYDPANDAMVVYGGGNQGGSMSDVWQLSLAGSPAWTQLHPVGAAPALLSPAAIYDPATRRVVIYGGYTITNGNPIYTSNTQLLSLKSDPPLWIAMHPVGTAPAARAGAASTFNTDTRRMLVAGGRDANAILFSSGYSLNLYSDFSLEVGVNDVSMGRVDSPDPTRCVTPGAQVRLFAVPFSGFKFVEWLGDLSGTTNPQTLTMDDHKVVLARFAPVAVATLMSVFEAAPADGGIEIRWQFTTPDDVASVALERASQPVGPWTAVDASFASRGDVAIAQDRSAAPGAPTFYRLVVDLRQGGKIIEGPVSAAAAAVLVSDITLLSPNPAFGVTRIDFAVARAGAVRLSVLDIAGRERAVLARGVYPAGRHTLRWDGRIGGAKAAAGIYFLRFEGPGQTRVKRLVML